MLICQLQKYLGNTLSTFAILLIYLSGIVPQLDHSEETTWIYQVDETVNI